MGRSVEELEAARTRGARWRRGIPVIALVVIGAILLAIPGRGTAVTACAVMALGVASVWVVSLVFYEIGLGEDLDRARGGDRH
jgi:hypothetical protein